MLQMGYSDRIGHISVPNREQLSGEMRAAVDAEIRGWQHTGLRVAEISDGDRLELTALEDLHLWRRAAQAGGLFSGERDETAGWSAQRLYSTAKEQLDAGNYESAIRMYEKLDTRFPFGRFAQQSQLDVAYAYFKRGDAESAIAASFAATRALSASLRVRM